jgi:hypothetical protein
MGFGVVDREPRPQFTGVAEREFKRTALSSATAAAEVDDESRTWTNCPSDVDTLSGPSSLIARLDDCNWLKTGEGVLGKSSC